MPTSVTGLTCSFAEAPCTGWFVDFLAPARPRWRWLRIASRWWIMVRFVPFVAFEKPLLYAARCVLPNPRNIQP